jgi:hypothetical protein
LGGQEWWLGPGLLGTFSNNLSGEQQELVLAILRTAQLETDPEASSAAEATEPRLTLRAEPVEGRPRRFRFIAEITGGEDTGIFCKSHGWGLDGKVTERTYPICPPADPLLLPVQRRYERSHTFASAGEYTVVFEYADLAASVTVEVE